MPRYLDDSVMCTGCAGCPGTLAAPINLNGLVASVDVSGSSF